MTTTATEHSPATDRKSKAVTALQELKNEKATIATRQKSTQETVERLNQGIVQAERSGETDNLRKMRDDRRAAEESVRDLERTLPIVVHELELAQGEMIMAERACCAESWNKIQTEQIALFRTVTEAVELIANSINEKERLAHRQQKILASVCPGADKNPTLIRHDLAFAITARLQDSPTTALRTIDWTCLRMTEQGNLV